MPKVIDPELKARAVRLVVEHQQEYPSLNAAAGAVAKQLGLGHETVRRWVVQAQVDTGRPSPQPTTNPWGPSVNVAMTIRMAAAIKPPLERCVLERSSHSWGLSGGVPQTN